MKKNKKFEEIINKALYGKTATEMMVKDMQEEEHYKIKHSSQPIQKEEEVELVGTCICGKCGEKRIKIDKKVIDSLKPPTPSDTFIEGKVKEMINSQEYLDARNELCELGKEKPLIDFLKSSLQSQRQSILEEIENWKQPNQEVSEYISGYNQALEDIKQLLK